MSCLCRSACGSATRPYIDTPVNYVTLITHILWSAPQLFANARHRLLRYQHVTAGNPASLAPSAPRFGNWLAGVPATRVRSRRTAPDARRARMKSAGKCGGHQHRVVKSLAAQGLLPKVSRGRIGARYAMNRNSRSTPDTGELPTYPAICCTKSAGELTLASDRPAGITIR